MEGSSSSISSGDEVISGIIGGRKDEIALSQSPVIMLRPLKPLYLGISRPIMGMKDSSRL